MAKHTPGPWEVSGFFINGPQGSNAETDSENWNSVAQTFGPDRRANANLIAAAPEMYTQLDNVRTMLDEALTYLDLADVDILIFKQMIKDIENILARAEGKEDSHGQS